VVPAGCRHAGAGPRALRTDRLARHLLTGFTTSPDSITDVDRAGQFLADDRPDAVASHALQLFRPVL
jgi:hypothetical protein